MSIVKRLVYMKQANVMSVAPMPGAAVDTPQHYSIPYPPPVGFTVQLDEDMLEIQRDQLMNTLVTRLKVHTTELFARSMAELNAPYIARVQELESEVAELKRIVGSP